MGVNCVKGGKQGFFALRSAAKDDIHIFGRPQVAMNIDRMPPDHNKGDFMCLEQGEHLLNLSGGNGVTRLCVCGGFGR